MAASLIDRGPIVFVSAGLLLMLLGVYMAGTESLNCDSRNDRVICQVRRARLLGLLTVERIDAFDVVDAGVRTSLTEHTEYRAGQQRGSSAGSSNHTLVLKTRDGQEVDALGGENSDAYADKVQALLSHRAQPPIDMTDSTWTVAIFCFGLGLVLFGFGAIARHAQRAEEQASETT